MNITTASNNSALDKGQSEEPNPKRVKCEDYVCVGDCDEIIESVDKKWQKVGRMWLEWSSRTVLLDGQRLND